MFSLLEQYRLLHRDPLVFGGRSLEPHVVQIAKLVRAYNAKSLLDYGCGKGEQYLKYKMHGAWGYGGIMPVLFDPAVEQFAARPKGKFDGVICTDVMEHALEEDLDALLADIFGFARHFVFFSISCREAKRLLPDGRNAHVTVKPPAWWADRVTRAKPAGVHFKIRFMD